MEKKENIYTVMFDIQGLNLAVTKTKQHSHFQTTYSGLDDVWDMLHPILREYRLLVIHRVLNEEVVTEVIHNDSGTRIMSATPFNKNLKAQEIGAVETYAKRHNLIGLFALRLVENENQLNRNDNPSTAKVSDKQINFLKILLKKNKISDSDYFARYKVNSFSELSKETVSNSIELLNKKKGE